MIKKSFLILALCNGLAYGAQCTSPDLSELKSRCQLHINARMKVSYGINLNLTGSPLVGQKIYYALIDKNLGDNTESEIITKTKLESNVAFIKFDHNIENALNRHQGALPDHDYLLTIYGIKTAVTDRNGKKTYLTTAVPIHIMELESTVFTKYDSEDDGKAISLSHPDNCQSLYLTFYGSVTTKIATLPQAIVKVNNLKGKPNKRWLEVNSTSCSKDFDCNDNKTTAIPNDYLLNGKKNDFENVNKYKAYSIGVSKELLSCLYSLRDPEQLWQPMLSNSVSVDIDVPYSMNFISPKSTLQPAEYTLGYKFKSNS